MKKLLKPKLTFALLLALAGTVIAGAQTTTPDLAALSANRAGWITFNPIKIEPGEEKDRVAVHLKATGPNYQDAGAWLDGVEFSEGVIEFDGKGHEKFNFIGIAFHGVDEKTTDIVYFRPFAFRSANAVDRSHTVQYVSEPKYPWPVLRKEFPNTYERGIENDPAPTDWFHAKIVIAGKKISVFVNGAARPSLEIEKLNDRTTGKIGLWVGPGDGGSFANLKLHARPDRKKPVSDTAGLPTGWRWVPDDWNFGRVTFKSWADRAGGEKDAFQFGLDGKAQRKQFADILAGGGDLMKEAMAGRAYDGSHAVLAGSDFGDGDIEADICASGADDYQGIFFRASEQALDSRKFDGEIVYFRPFYSNNEKPRYPAIQYFAQQRDGADRRMAGGLQKDTAIPKDTWFHVRIRVRGKEAAVYIDGGAEPVFVVPALGSGRSRGLVGFWAWNGRLANLKITPVETRQ